MYKKNQREKKNTCAKPSGEARFERMIYGRACIVCGENLTQWGMVVGCAFECAFEYVRGGKGLAPKKTETERGSSVSDVLCQVAW